ncbi:MAG: metal ABC transporter permease [Phycisphaerales bacterium]|nr:metal ABC transporter permease [Phycisphaerales bacterium]
MLRVVEAATGADGGLFRHAVLTALSVAIMCGGLSVFVVLRRLGFVGHGVAHAAFGGVGVVAVLGLTAAGGAMTVPGYALIAVFCIGVAAAIAWTSSRGAAGAPGRAAWREDTVIGLFLVASVATGAILLHAAGPARAGRIESWVFGSILEADRTDSAAAALVAGVVVLALAWFRRPLLFWAFDEPAAEAFGVRTARTRLLLMALLGVAVVLSMRVAGVVLSTALLVLPGAAAVQLSRRLVPVFALGVAAAVVGVLAGLEASLRLDTPPGPTIVLTLVAMASAAWAVGRARGR